MRRPDRYTEFRTVKWYARRSAADRLGHPVALGDTTAQFTDTSGLIGTSSRFAGVKEDRPKDVVSAPTRGYPEYVAIIDQVRTDMTTAMKAGEKERVGALRLVLSELQKAVKDGNGDELAVLRRERKRRLDAAEQYQAASRPELAAHEEFEATLITSYLPAELDDAGLDEMITTVIEELGVSDVKDMGQVMKAVMARGGGRVDGKRASARVREALRA